MMNTEFKVKAKRLLYKIEVEWEATNFQDWIFEARHEAEEKSTGDH